MLPISETSKRNWIIGTQAKTLLVSFPDLNLTLTNDSIVSESLSLTEELEQKYNLTFTGCIASRLSLKVRALTQDVRGQKVVIIIQIGTDTPLPLFIGRIDSQDNLSHRDVLTSLEAYDDLVRVNNTDVKAWYESLTFPMTVAAFRASFWSYLGITEELTTLPNDSLSMTKTITDEVINAGKIAKWICQLNARYGRINRAGNFEYVKLTPITEGLYPANDLYPAEDLYPSDENYNSEFTTGTYNTVEYEPFKTAPITGVYIWDMGGINQGQAGASGNVFSIADNPLSWAVNMMTAAANIFEEIKDVQFIPADISAIGLPYIEVGDIIMLHTDENMIRTYILSRTLNGIQALTDAFRSDSDEYLTVYKESAATATSKNGQNILEIQAEIVQMNTLIAERATINQLNAVSARVGSLEADHVSVASLNAVDAKINALDAIAITTQNLSAQSIAASQIKSGKIKANQLDASDIASTLFTSVQVQARGIYATDGIRCANSAWFSGNYCRITADNGITYNIPYLNIYT